MKREKIQELYEVSEQEYQGTCSVMGLKSPADLNGNQMDDFDKIRTWFTTKTVKNFKEAKDRYEEEKAKLTTTVDSIEQFAPMIESYAEAAVHSVYKGLQQANQEFNEASRRRFYDAFWRIASSPKIQEQYLQPACDGDTIDASFLPMEEVKPVLLQSAP